VACYIVFYCLVVNRVGPKFSNVFNIRREVENGWNILSSTLGSGLLVGVVLQSRSLFWNISVDDDFRFEVVGEKYSKFQYYGKIYFVMQLIMIYSAIDMFCSCYAVEKIYFCCAVVQFCFVKSRSIMSLYVVEWQFCHYLICRLLENMNIGIIFLKIIKICLTGHKHFWKCLH